MTPSSQAQAARSMKVTRLCRLLIESSWLGDFLKKIGTKSPVLHVLRELETHASGEALTACFALLT